MAKVSKSASRSKAAKLNSSTVGRPQAGSATSGSSKIVVKPLNTRLSMPNRVAKWLRQKWLKWLLLFGVGMLAVSGGFVGAWIGQATLKPQPSVVAKSVAESTGSLLTQPAFSPAAGSAQPLERPLRSAEPTLPSKSEALNSPTPSPTAVSPSPGFDCATAPNATQTAGAPSNVELTQFVQNVSRTANWVEQPALSVGAIASQVASPLLAYLNSAPFPSISPAARQAKVPVMMYHDILPEKLVFFDVTPEEFEQHLQLIQQKGATPISLDQLVNHLSTGMPLPPKPILLTFDDGYQGHYTHVYPLLKKYGFPGVFAIYTDKVGKQMGRSSLSWEQLRQMAKDPLVTISSHSVTHQPMAGMAANQLVIETQLSKQILERELGIPIRYFTYPIGKYDQSATEAVRTAGYAAALVMRDMDEKLAGESADLLTIERVGQSRIAEMLDLADGGPPLAPVAMGFNFSAPVRRIDATIDQVPFVFIAGGKPVTIHAATRAQVPEILANTQAIAAVDGTFFSLEQLDSNELLGPVYSQSTGQFIPGKRGEIPFLEDRPLVLIGPDSVKFVPFKHKQHNTLEALQAEMSNVTDAFVAAGWLVENGRPQPIERFGKLYSVNEARHRAFWGINQQGQPQIGVSAEPIGSVDLGIALAKAGFQTAVMLDSGASTSLAFKGESLVGYTPRPVPHVVALIPPPGDKGAVCAPTVASN
jgi:poly-beta-1,6-N-acetyl-D-glucosamine N-deacetylase